MPSYVVTWVHLGAAGILLGGLVFIQFVLNPGIRIIASEAQRAEVMRTIGRGFRSLSWVSLITLILTGAYQMLKESGSARIETDWGVVLLLKLFLFAITFGLLLVHDFILDPYAAPSKSSVVSPLNVTRADWIQKTALCMAFLVLLVASYLTTI